MAHLKDRVFLADMLTNLFKKCDRGLKTHGRLTFRLLYALSVNRYKFNALPFHLTARGKYILF